MPSCVKNFCYGLQKYVLKDTNIDYTPSTDTAICLLTQRLDEYVHLPAGN